jgi:hypothetical protein
MAPLSFRRDKTPVPETSAIANAAESSASPGRSFRFLRRKPSMSARQHSDSDASSAMPNTASTTASFGDPLENLPANAEVAYRPVSRGSEPNTGPVAAIAAAGVGDAGVDPLRRTGVWGDSDGVVVINSCTGDLPRPSKVGSEHPFLSNMASDRSLGPPLTPPTAVDLTPAPIYPTALSPPRRPMPKSRPADAPSLSLDSPIPGLGPSPRPTITAEWLSRKPSGRRRSNGAAGQTGSRAGSEGSPQPRLRAAAPITPTRSRAPSASTTASASTSAAESDDGEVGVVSSKRRSHRDATGLYEVEVVCNDTREDNEEMRWEVVVRKRRPTEGSQAQAPTSPLPLSTSTSVAPAPSTASSINLSLSLDQPTGKLVFIAFPMDIHATPRRKPRSTAPSTPPRPVTPPPAPNPNLSTPPSLGHRKGVSESYMYPSPSRAGRRSPSQPSPRVSEIWTPRRTRMVSASDLNGGLYARGTVDGMSEELEQVDTSGRHRSDEEERAARVARWNHDKI